MVRSDNYERRERVATTAASTACVQSGARCGLWVILHENCTGSAFCLSTSNDIYDYLQT